MLKNIVSLPGGKLRSGVVEVGGDPKLNTNPSGAELRAETELEPSGTVKDDKG